MNEFIESMNEFTHNGTLHEYNHEQALELARHYLKQCPADQQTGLALRIAAALSARYHYQLTEQALGVRNCFENRIKEKISLWVKSHCANAVKMAGFMIQGSLNFASRLFKSFIEPAITQTALSYSLVLNPAIVPPLSDIPLNAILDHNDQITSVVDKKDQSVTREYRDLEYVKWYSEAIVAEIGKNNPDMKQPGMKSALKRNSVPTGAETKINENFDAVKPFGRLNLNIERRRMEPALEIPKARAATAQSATLRPVRELRPNAEIHAVLMSNDYKFQNCIKPYRDELQSRDRRISVRFDITPAGSVTNISISKKTGNQDIVRRLKLQLMQLKFSKVDLRFGDQTVYHTFFL